MDLCQAYYIEKRNNDDHIDLNGKWDFCWRDTACDSVDSLTFDYQCTLPSSVYHSLSASGVLPHPYYGTNSKDYGWVDEKVWYYRKRFNLDRASFDGNAYLCFDGVAYYCRLWVNGTLLGEHEGCMTSGDLHILHALFFGDAVVGTKLLHGFQHGLQHFGIGFAGVFCLSDPYASPLSLNSL